MKNVAEKCCRNPAKRKETKRFEKKEKKKSTGWKYFVNNKRYTTRRRRNQHIRVYKVHHACMRAKEKHRMETETD